MPSHITWKAIPFALQTSYFDRSCLEAVSAFCLVFNLSSHERNKDAADNATADKILYAFSLAHIAQHVDM